MTSGRRDPEACASCRPGTSCRTSGSAATSDGNIRTGTNVAGGGATNRPSRTCRRHVNNRPGYTPCRAATSVTRAPGSSVSATIRSFSSIDQRRRRSRPVMISIAPPLTDLKLRLMHSFKVKSLRHRQSRRKTWLPGRLHGIVAPCLFNCAIDGELFLAYVEQQLAPILVPGDIVIADNLPSHKVVGVREAIEARAASLW